MHSPAVIPQQNGTRWESRWPSPTFGQFCWQQFRGFSCRLSTNKFRPSSYVVWTMFVLILTVTAVYGFLENRKLTVLDVEDDTEQTYVYSFFRFREILFIIFTKRTFLVFCEAKWWSHSFRNERKMRRWAQWTVCEHAVRIDRSDSRTTFKSFEVIALRFLSFGFWSSPIPDVSSLRRFVCLLFSIFQWGRFTLLCIPTHDLRGCRISHRCRSAPDKQEGTIVDSVESN